MSGSRPGYLEKIFEISRLHPERIAITLMEPDAGRHSWTFRELEQLTRRYRSAFFEQGVQGGSRVALLLPSGPDFIAAALALTSLQAIFAPMSPRLTSHELNLLLLDLQPEGLILLERSRAAVEAAIAGVGSLRFALVPDAAGDTDPTPMAPTLTVQRLPERFIDEADLRAVISHNPVVSCHHTYKGLGFPLGVLHRYHDYTCCLDALAAAFPQEEGATHLVGLPFHQVYSLTACVLGPLGEGCRLLITQRLHEIDIIGTLIREQVQSACLVPLLVKKVVARGKARRERQQPFHFHPKLILASGGSLLSTELAKEAADVLGVPVHQGYGLTETLPVCGTTPSHNPMGTLGRPYSNEVEIAILDHEGRRMPAGVAGEIAIRGDSVTLSFWGDPAQAQALLRSGWLMSGDLGYLDSSGDLHFLGRRMAFAKVASQMVDLTEVEAIVARHPAVERVRITVAPHPELGESLIGSVVVKPFATVSELELKQTCQKLLSTHKVPRDFRIYRSRRVQEAY